MAMALPLTSRDSSPIFKWSGISNIILDESYAIKEGSNIKLCTIARNEGDGSKHFRQRKMPVLR